ncbi:SH3 domain-containing kinase-binding protein 1 isoform X4 [Eleginops maclovinus]|uniref:SH3 domain-containing kinase-binding protein 1 isoform X4 n=1 Tax=Eleginops maclovinus TaxID=56733 RepID=UPI003080A25B
MGNYSSALIPDTEEFDSVVSMAERLNEQVALMMEEEEQLKQSAGMDSLSLQENSQEMSQNGPTSRSPPSLEQVQSDLRELRNQFELMKSQHNKEIKLLMSELDEEKRIRLTLQMEMQRMKKHMSK